MAMDWTTCDVAETGWTFRSRTSLRSMPPVAAAGLCQPPWPDLQWHGFADQVEREARMKNASAQ